MKRTPLKRKTPLARRSKRKAASWAKYDKFMLPYKSMDCAVCMVMGQPNCGPVCGHHILGKQSHPQFRMERKNIIPLCLEHHMTSPFLCPHSTDNRAVKRWWEWLQMYRQEQYEWAMGHK